MADGIAITPGSGATVATDDVGGAHYQRVKLALGSDGSATDAASGEGANGSSVLRVSVATNDAVSSALADPGGTSTASITRPSDTTAYSANDAMSNSTSAPTAGGMSFTVARAIGRGAILTDLVVIASAGTLYQGVLDLFDTAPTAINDNAAYTVSDAEMLTWIGEIPFSMESIGANSRAHVKHLGLACTSVASTVLRGLVRITGAVTPGNAEVITFRLKYAPIG